MIDLTTYFKSYETKTAQKTSLIIYCSNDISKKIIEDVIILRFLLIRVDCAGASSAEARAGNELKCDDA